MVPRRVITTWLVLFGLLVVAFAGTVLILNATLYSAGGFAGSYLAALARHDVAAAAGMAGAAPADEAKASRELLDPRALGELTDIHQLSDTDQGGGAHRVSYRYEFAGGASGTTSFIVQYAGTHLGFFSEWRFASSPLSVLSVTPQHEAAFTVNGFQLSSTGPSVAKKFLALTPGRYVLGNESDYFTAKPVAVPITKAGGTTTATLDIEASANFGKAVQKQLESYLKKCATQQVLLPTDCPFGKQMSDRIEGLPAWSIVRYPKVSILPGAKPGSWALPDTPATAHLTVKVRSLFDGSVSTFDEDVPFNVNYLITFTADGGLLITAQ